VKIPAPYDPVAFTKSQVASIQALAAGIADERQQRRAFDCILTSVCDLNGLSYRPDEAGGERATAFAEGKRFVALQLCKALKLNIDLIKE
jgi:hypothetical protein